jgi:hypothetical protein
MNKLSVMFVVMITFLIVLPMHELVLGGGQDQERPTYEEYIQSHLPDRQEIDVFLNGMSWAQFDPDVGYILGNYMPHDGLDDSSTISTVQKNGARKASLYLDKPCRINTYGNSFTLCHQVSDGETWQEYLAAHLGEPIRNFGMGGFGLYQAYRRMLREEQTDHAAPYVMLYIWGDDHIRSLLRCRYMLTADWNRTQDRKEGVGRMFHGNFWSNLELDLESGKFLERASLLPTRDSLYRMTDAKWMVEHLKDDLALQMSLYARGEIRDIDGARLKQLAGRLDRSDLVDDAAVNADISRQTVAALLDAYSFAATKYILQQAKTFTEKHNKKLLVILLDPYRVTRSLLHGNKRYDQEIVDFLETQDFDCFDMNLVHLKDFQDFKISVDQYLRRYYIGHYSPAGNHFFAYAIKDKVVEWLDPKPLPYRDTQQQTIDFKGYLDKY